jgi:hypothetical protein
MSYLYSDSESWEVVEQHSAGCRYRSYGTGTIEERLASADDIQKYAGKSSAWIESIPHILANSRESLIRR